MCRLTEANISIAKCPGMVHANGGNDEFEWNITKTHVIKPWSNLPQSNPKVTAYYCTSWNIQALLNKALFKTNINIHTESNETPKLDTRWTMKSSQCCHVRHGSMTSPRYNPQLPSWIFSGASWRHLQLVASQDPHLDMDHAHHLLPTEDSSKQWWADAVIHWYGDTDTAIRYWYRYW